MMNYKVVATVEAKEIAETMTLDINGKPKQFKVVSFEEVFDKAKFATADIYIGFNGETARAFQPTISKPVVFKTESGEIRVLEPGAWVTDKGAALLNRVFSQAYQLHSAYSTKDEIPADKVYGKLIEILYPTNDISVFSKFANIEQIEDVLSFMHEEWKIRNEDQRTSKVELFVSYKDLSNSEQLKYVRRFESILKKAESFENGILKDYRFSWITDSLDPDTISLYDGIWHNYRDEREYHNNYSPDLAGGEPIGLYRFQDIIRDYEHGKTAKAIRGAVATIGLEELGVGSTNNQLVNLQVYTAITATNLGHNNTVAEKVLKLDDNSVYYRVQVSDDVVVKTKDGNESKVGKFGSVLVSIEGGKAIGIHGLNSSEYDGAYENYDRHMHELAREQGYSEFVASLPEDQQQALASTKKGIESYLEGPRDDEPSRALSTAVFCDWKVVGENKVQIHINANRNPENGEIYGVPRASALSKRMQGLLSRPEGLTFSISASDFIGMIDETTVSDEVKFRGWGYFKVLSGIDRSYVEGDPKGSYVSEKLVETEKAERKQIEEEAIRKANEPDEDYLEEQRKIQVYLDKGYPYSRAVQQVQDDEESAYQDMVHWLTKD